MSLKFPRTTRSNRRHGSVRIVVTAILIAGALVAAGFAHPQSATASAPYWNPRSIDTGPVPADAVAVDSTTNTVYVAAAGRVVVNGETNLQQTWITVPYSAGSVRRDIAVNEITHRVYVTDGHGSVTVIDGTTDTVIGTPITVGQYPVAIAVNDLTNTVYVSNQTASSISVIDGSTNAVTATLTGGGGDIAVDSLTNRIYAVTNLIRVDIPAFLMVIDGSDNSRIGSIQVHLTSPGTALAIDESTDTVYISASTTGTGTITALDGATYATLRTITVATPGWTLAVDSATKTLLTANVSNHVTVIDATNGTTVSDVALRDDAQVYDIAANSITHVAYAASSVVQGAGGSVEMVQPGSAPVVIPQPANGSLPVYRFWSPTLHSHFYTISAVEKDTILKTYPIRIWSFEGAAFRAYTTQAPGTVPLYRFWSSRLGDHFYTTNAAERDYIIGHYDHATWNYEGVAYYVFPNDSPYSGTLTVARFWSPDLQTHFYTSNATERDGIIATYPTHVWSYEGNDFRVLPPY
ncbi:hypothetical protein BH09ACT1_BH09ACT1_02170 [soil metagenome]